MTREEATQWLKHINITDFGWDDYAMQDSQKEIRERCEQSIREAIDMAIEALQSTMSQERVNHEATNDLISKADVLEGLKHSTAYLHDDIYTIVNRIPSAETTGALDDAIAKYVADGLMELPVVRCKDCRHWNSETKGCKRNPSVEAWQEDDFCKYGERQCNYFGERREE